MSNRLNELFNGWKKVPTRANMETIMETLHKRVRERYSDIYPDNEDIAQNVCADVWIAIMSGTYDDTGKFAAFAATVARRTAATFYTLRAKQPVGMSDEELENLLDKE